MNLLAAKTRKKGHKFIDEFKILTDEIHKFIKNHRIVLLLKMRHFSHLIDDEINA